MSIKIKIHSTVDLITNSSTVIFTYSGNAVEPLKQLVNEMLKLQGSNKTFEDVFYYGVFCEDDDYIDSEHFPKPNYPNDDYRIQNEINYNFMQNLKHQIMQGEIDYPQWMKDVDESEDYDYFSKETFIELIPKDEQYSDLANKLLKYLYSTSHEATRDG